MFRFKLILIGIGIALGYYGYEEFTVSQHASIAAAEVELATLEASTELENHHIKIGAHWAVYPGCIYEYQMEKYETGEPTASTKVTLTYYPIISNTHPYLTAIDTLTAQFGNLESIPDEQWPEFKQFTVLVKSERFNTLGSIPEDWLEEGSLQGLVINRIESLDSEEAGLLRESFPHIDLDNVLIVEEGRSPSSQKKSVGMMAGGGVLILAGIFLLIKRSED